MNGFLSFPSYSIDHCGVYCYSYLLHKMITDWGNSNYVSLKCEVLESVISALRPDLIVRCCQHGPKPLHPRHGAPFKRCLVEADLTPSLGCRRRIVVTTCPLPIVDLSAFIFGFLFFNVAVITVEHVINGFIGGKSEHNAFPSWRLFSLFPSPCWPEHDSCLVYIHLCLSFIINWPLDDHEKQEQNQ